MFPSPTVGGLCCRHSSGFFKKATSDRLFLGPCPRLLRRVSFRTPSLRSGCRCCPSSLCLITDVAKRPCLCCNFFTINLLDLFIFLYVTSFLVLRVRILCCHRADSALKSCPPFFSKGRRCVKRAPHTALAYKCTLCAFFEKRSIIFQSLFCNRPDIYCDPRALNIDILPVQMPSTIRGTSLQTGPLGVYERRGN